MHRYVQPYQVAQIMSSPTKLRVNLDTTVTVVHGNYSRTYTDMFSPTKLRIRHGNYDRTYTDMPSPTNLTANHGTTVVHAQVCSALSS